MLHVVNVLTSGYLLCLCSFVVPMTRLCHQMLQMTKLNTDVEYISAALNWRAYSISLI